MKVIRGLSDAGEIFAGTGKTVVTIGIFDGVHLGHRQVIENTCRLARDMRAPGVVLTFSSHPGKTLDTGNAPPLISSTEHKLKLIEALGADYCILPDFKRELSTLSPERFVREILVDTLKAKGICVGHDFVFGKDRAGNINFLKELGRRLDIKVVVLEPVKMEGKIISSSLIRRMIIKGELEDAGRLLGRPVSILGTVVEGKQRGRKLNYPTANIDPHHEAIPPPGVYCVRAEYGKNTYKGILNIGTAPTFDVNEDRIEVHLFDFDKDIYGDEVEVIFVEKIREELKFSTVRDLAEQIRADEDKARKILK